MKLLTILPGFSSGGAENMVYELNKQLHKTNVENYILCYSGKQNTELEKKAEKIAKVIFLNCAGTVNIKNITRVCAVIDKIGPDIVHAHMGGALFGALWTLKKRRALVVTIHTVPQKAFTSRIEKILRFRMLFGKFQLVAVSKENKKLADNYYHMKQGCISVNNGINLERFYKKDHDIFTYINVARQDDNKNQKMLLNVFSKLHKDFPNIKLILLGDGPNHDILQQQCKNLDLKEFVSLPGNVADTEKYYAEADIYVQTSHREAMPLSILEAMASGLPIISTNVGGIKDVVKGNGIMIEDGDEKGLYDAMKYMVVASKETIRNYSTNSLNIVKEYSSKKMVVEYNKIYQQLLGN